MNLIESVHASMFDRYETKRAWGKAIDDLQALWRAVDGDPKRAPYARDVLGAMKTLRGWHQWLLSVGGDPEAGIATVTAADMQARLKAKLWGYSMWATLVMGFVLVRVSPRESALTVLGTLAVLFGPIVGLIGWLRTRGRAKRVHRELTELQETFGKFRTFLAEPLGGQLLTRAASEHPLLQEQLPS